MAKVGYRPLVEAQFALLRGWASRNSRYVSDTWLAADRSAMSITFDGIKVPVLDGDRLRVVSKVQFTFLLGSSYPSSRPVLEVSPRNLLSAHIFPNGTVCIWDDYYPALQLWTAPRDLVMELQTGHHNPRSPANGEVAAWLSRAKNLRRLREVIGRPVRLLDPMPLTIRTAPRPAMRTLAGG